MAAVPQQAADLFVDVLYPAGCRAVVLSGGVGRGTLALWRELAERRLTARFGSEAPWAVGTQPARVHLPAQGLSKPVLSSAMEVPSDIEERRSFCSEADVMLELFVARCTERGVDVHFGGDPMAGDLRRGNGGDPSTHSPGEASNAAFAFLESASTNSGANCALSAETLLRVGVDLDVVALVQHPQAHRRACLTWHRQRGVPPMGWCPQPTEPQLGVSRDEMLLYALGELTRIEAYSHPSKDFLVMPPDYPRHLRPLLARMETVLRQRVKLTLDSGALSAYASSLGLIDP